MPCSLVNIYSTFKENDCFVTRKKKKLSNEETSTWAHHNWVISQVFCNEGSNSFRNTEIYQIIRSHFPEENNNCGYFLTKIFTPVCQVLYSVLLIKLNKFAPDVSQYWIASSDTTRCSNEWPLTVSLLHNCAFVSKWVQ